MKQIQGLTFSCAMKPPGMMQMVRSWLYVYLYVLYVHGVSVSPEIINIFIINPPEFSFMAM